MQIDNMKWALEDEKYIVEDENRIERSITVYFIISIFCLWVFWSLI